MPMYSIAKAGGSKPPFVATTSAQAVSAACVRAVVEDADELIVNRVPMRPALCLFEAFPSLPRAVDRAFPWLYDFNRRCNGDDPVSAISTSEASTAMTLHTIKISPAAALVAFEPLFVMIRIRGINFRGIGSAEFSSW